jgi:hypothetical protein
MVSQPGRRPLFCFFNDTGAYADDQPSTKVLYKSLKLC